MTNFRTLDLNLLRVFDAVMAEAIATVFGEYVDKHGIAEIGKIFSEGVRIEVGDMLPSSHYAELVKRVPPIWDKLSGLYACGNDMNSIMGGHYPSGGITLGPAMTFGYLAARHAAALPPH